jgi:cell division septal protein FtsQ
MGLAVFISLAGWKVAQAGGPLLAHWFEVRNVSLIGARHVTRAEVLERLALRPGETLFSVTPSRLASQLQSHPWIREVTVSRWFPGTLRVSVTERRPAAVLKAPAFSLLLDEEGRVLSVLVKGTEPGLPVLVGIEPHGLMLGDAVSRRAALNGIKVAALISQTFQSQPQVDVGRPDRQVATVEGRRFHFGVSAIEEQWGRYQHVERAVRASGRPELGLGDIDLRYHGKVIVRERG